ESLNPRTGQPIEPGTAEGPGTEVPDFLQPGGGLEGGPGGMQRPSGGMSAREGGGGFRQNMGEGGAANNMSVSYKLLRFTDFKVEPGRKYRYRARLTLENPNHPQKVATGVASGAGGGVSKDPPPQSLDRDVEAGLRELAKEEAKKGKRIFYRDTDWSEVSPVISLPDPITIAGGEVTPGRETKVPGGTVPTSEPSGKVMVIQWDDFFAANVVGEADIARGTVLNFSPKEAEALHPLRLEFVKMKDYPIRANSVVVDLRGGEKLPGGDPQEPLHAPGEIAVIDQNGQLVVHGEAQDNPIWQRYGKFEPKPIDPDLGMSGSGEPGRGLEDVLTPKRPSRQRRNGGE
ncbi:MAG TPA: hypothetical protein VL096_04130, partial [Pirellulaceae bacterium]|nr:hypothetical protein [Pirellulaceae bacterium]